MSSATKSGSASGKGHEGRHHLAHYFDTRAQQYDSHKLGMWLFIFTELLLFGGLFITYSVYRYNHASAFSLAAEELDVTMGTINTVILLISSWL